MTHQQLMREIETALYENRRKTPPRPDPTFEALAQAHVPVMLEAATRLAAIDHDCPIAARLRHAIYHTRDLRHRAEQARANALGPSDGAMMLITRLHRAAVAAGQNGSDWQSWESGEAERAVASMVCDFERTIAHQSAELEQLRAALHLAECKLVERSREPAALERAS